MINWVMAIKQGQGKGGRGGMVSQRWFVSAPFDKVKVKPTFGAQNMFCIGGKTKNQISPSFSLSNFRFVSFSRCYIKYLETIHQKKREQTWDASYDTSWLMAHGSWLMLVFTTLFRISRGAILRVLM